MGTEVAGYVMAQVRLLVRNRARVSKGRRQRVRSWVLKSLLAPPRSDQLSLQPSLANKKSIGIPELIYNSLMKVTR